MVLGNLKEATHLKNCSQSSVFFRNRLLSKRTTFLFPGVFECLAVEYDKCLNEAYEDEVENGDEANQDMFEVESDDEVYEDAVQVEIDNKGIWKFPG